jgi:hypothetical protein
MAEPLASQITPMISVDYVERAVTFFKRIGFRSIAEIKGPAVWAFMRRRKHRAYFDRYNKTIEKAYNESKIDKDRSKQQLSIIKEDLTHEYMSGNLTEDQIEKLNDGIDEKIKDIKEKKMTENFTMFKKELMTLTKSQITKNLEKR